ncbi:conserved hypothetical protein [Culex quinquefasciatus]|uniref:Fork-head domain-containing protein n=1 Tax=Culex quinquefasciatus TaxID=7176 RepID=B0W3G7_CULQU|nr:conserved hypothetical protein [Culex quinquefasciatus]|eukprot:XP_001843251.1 conserved hypothetical protein [Culex quinquefasciatus]
MDLYVSDSMQDMLDIDIKSEVATVVGGVNEFSSLMNFDLPSLELDSNSTDAEANGWCGGGPTKWSSGDIYADVGACVNPNSVMPVMVSAQSSLLKSPKQNVNLNATVAPINDPTLPSPKERKSHLTFSPNTIKVPMVIQHQKPTIVTGLTQIQRINGLDTVKKDLSTHMLKEDGGNKIIVRNHQVPVNGGGSSPGSGLGVGLGKGQHHQTAGGNRWPHVRPTGMQFKNLKNVQKITAINGISGGIKRDSSPARTTLQGQTQLISVNGGSPKVLNRSLIQLSNGQNGKPSMVQLANGNLVAVPKNAKPKPIDSGFPKPAYSYSCLIAMALKNSRSGSLPVSEIYSFMCEHFPYFKTAPNGWKNSVRHNLSLNKCFEKIEKPVTNGGQRKGCLWAMNPSKITKMDDEVQKWSRKDPMAIRKAMVHPEHLDALERGEMKHGSSGDSDEGEPDDEISDSDEVEEGEEVEDAEEEIEIEQEADSFIINTPESMEDPEGEEVSVDFDMEPLFRQKGWHVPRQFLPGLAWLHPHRTIHRDGHKGGPFAERDAVAVKGQFREARFHASLELAGTRDPRQDVRFQIFGGVVGRDDFVGVRKQMVVPDGAREGTVELEMFSMPEGRFRVGQGFDGSSEVRD